jgi:2-methylaconitate cis-trans-isomerase PrpF
MTQRRIRAVYMRGGTSRCLVFHARDLPPAGPARDAILLAALGSPDPYGRQLDGLGGGISSLSKACIIGPATIPGADVDYTFAQVEIRKASVDYAGNCGNCSSSVGPFAIDEGLVPAREGETVVRIHNTNTRKLIVAHVPVVGGEAAVHGDFELAGVPGRGARIALDFVEPGGAGTGRLLPTGRPREVVAGVEVSCVDATNPVVFVRARDLGLTGIEPPAAVDADHELSARLEKLRVEAAARMGMAESAAVPKIAFVAPPTEVTTLDGLRHPAESCDVVARAISMGNCHRAFPLTAAMCLAVAARLEGSLVHEAARRHPGDVRLSHPSGVLPLDAVVSLKDGEPWAERVTVYRTARRLMEGFVRIP